MRQTDIKIYPLEHWKNSLQCALSHKITCWCAGIFSCQMKIKCLNEQNFANQNDEIIPTFISDNKREQ